MAAAVGINAALIAALMLSSPEIFAPPEPTLDGYNIPIAPPPPETKPEPKVDQNPVQPRRSAQPMVPDVVIDTPRPSDPFVLPPADPLPNPGDALTGTDIGPVTPVVPAKPAPVLVAAAPDPRAAGAFQPPYPPARQREGVEARITVRVLVGEDGRVRAVEPVGAVDDAFFATTRRHALARWRFTPATRDGVPYETWKTMSVRFELAE
jgi:protein TonB